jgi:hypothetical protein
MSNTRVYILGPMRGKSLYNFPAFDSMAEELRRVELEPVNPAQLDRENGFDALLLPHDFDWNSIAEGLNLDDIITRDIEALRTCAYYVALDGWERSTGAKAEKSILDWQGATRLAPVANYETDRVKFETWQEPPATASGEVRVTDPTTGGQKGQKLQRFDLIPGEPLWELAEVYGRGAKKYADNNWAKGYSWRLSFGALNRHLWAWWRGEERDELGNHHLAQVAWHAFTLLWFQKYKRGTDDRIINGLLTG